MSGLDGKDRGNIDPDDIDPEDAEAEDGRAAGDGQAEDEDFEEPIADDDLADYDEADEDVKVVDEALTHKDQNARALAIRRALEERLEAKRLSRDLDYLDLDVDE